MLIRGCVGRRGPRPADSLLTGATGPLPLTLPDNPLDRWPRRLRPVRPEQRQLRPLAATRPLTRPSRLCQLDYHSWQAYDGAVKTGGPNSVNEHQRGCQVRSWDGPLRRLVIRESSGLVAATRGPTARRSPSDFPAGLNEFETGLPVAGGVSGAKKRVAVASEQRVWEGLGQYA
jgi:hypothetical protein